MGRPAISLGRMLGIPIALDYSWFLVFAFLTWTLAVGYYPAEFPNWPTAEFWIVGAVTSILLFASVLLHELGHSVVAMRYKIPVHSITLYVFGGVSQIDTEPPTAMAEFWIAIAGPAVSFALAILFGLLQPILSDLAPLLALARYLAYINGFLGLFNLIPGFPLDGGRVFRAIAWGITHSLRRATLMAGNLGRFIGFLFILFGVWQVLSGNLINGLWIAFIGWFLESAAVGEVQTQGIRDSLAGHRVSQAMSRNHTAVSADITLQQMVDDHILGRGVRAFMVQRDDEVIGLLTLHNIREHPRTEWSTTTAVQAMIPMAQVKQTAPDADLWEALEEMQRDGVNQMPVMKDGQLLGMLGRGDVITFLRTLRELDA